MSTPGLAAWLRPEIEARLNLAREACHGTDGHWWRGSSVMFMDGTREPTGPLYGGGPVIGYDDEVFGGEHIVVYDEGAPSGWQFDHIAANDPRSVIAWCESELAILDEHAEIGRNSRDGPVCNACVNIGVDPANEAEFYVPYPCRTVRLIGKGYRHRDRYREEWAP